MLLIGCVFFSSSFVFVLLWWVIQAAPIGSGHLRLVLHIWEDLLYIEDSAYRILYISYRYTVCDILPAYLDRSEEYTMRSPG